MTDDKKECCWREGKPCEYGMTPKLVKILLNQEKQEPSE